jgi:hypothetical protein
MMLITTLVVSFLVCCMLEVRLGWSSVQAAGYKPVGSNPTGAWLFVCCECCVLSGRGLCDELITRPEESYRM